MVPASALNDNTVSTKFITPHVCDVSGVIVLTSSVCVCVCVSVTTLTAEQTDVRNEFWHGGQVEGYLGQVHRSTL